MPKRVITPEVDELIIRAVKDNPTNIRQSLMKVSEQTGINFDTINTRWYHTLRKKQKCFFMMSPEASKVSINKKNISIDTTQMRQELEMKMDIMKKVLKLLEKL